MRIVHTVLILVTALVCAHANCAEPSYPSRPIQLVVTVPPGGYTLLLNTITTHGIGPHLYANLPYDPAKDFSPVILLAKLPLIMAVTASLPARSVGDVISRFI